MSSRQKLELTWIGKEKRPKLEPRILLEDPEKSYHAKQRVTDNDIFDNRLIFGDNLSAEQLQALSDEVGADRSLLVCCSAFRGVTAAKAHERWPNLTLKKIPKMVLARCEWGQDDYSLNVANLPMAKPEPPSSQPAAKGRANKAVATLDLFGDGGEGL